MRSPSLYFPFRTQVPNVWFRGKVQPHRISAAIALRRKLRQGPPLGGIRRPCNRQLQAFPFQNSCNAQSQQHNLASRLKGYSWSRTILASQRIREKNRGRHVPSLPGRPRQQMRAAQRPTLSLAYYFAEGNPSLATSISPAEPLLPAAYRPSSGSRSAPISHRVRDARRSSIPAPRRYLHARPSSAQTRHRCRDRRR